MEDPTFVEIPDDCRIKTQWSDGKLRIIWHKDGEAIAGIVVSKESAALTGAVISVALTEKQ